MTTPIDAAGIVAALVKPLEWHHYDVWTWWAECPSGTYHVEERNGGWRVQLRVGGLVHDVLATEDTTPEDLAAAQAAAEADYRARIAAALDVGPILALVGAGQALAKIKGDVIGDVKAAHYSRKDAASEWMREDDRDFLRGLRSLLDQLDVALAAFKEASHG